MDEEVPMQRILLGLLVLVVLLWVFARFGI
jgi:hypothetical protein